MKKVMFRTYFYRNKGDERPAAVAYSVKGKNPSSQQFLFIRGVEFIEFGARHQMIRYAELAGLKHRVTTRWQVDTI